MSNPVRYSSACHESGHALVAWYFRLRVLAMQVDDKGRGHTKVVKRRGLPIEPQLTIIVAGSMAVHLAEARHLTNSAQADHLMLICKLAKIAEAERERHRADAHKRARAILEPRLNRLKFMAAKLATRGEISEREIEELLGRHHSLPLRLHVTAPRSRQAF
jgi:hypothetical protein